jgi:uncharacterized protein YraI
MKSLHTLLALLTIALAALTTSTATADDAESYIAVVTGNNVYVRSGAADSYYPFGRVNTGDLVKVTGERFNWARVQTYGPTFTSERFFGYIIYPTTQPGRFRLSSDGKSGTTLGRTHVLAPNINTNNNPNDSWKPLIRLEADTPVTVLETTTTANNTVHRVVLPKEAEAWISTAYLRRATPEQVKTWERAVNPEAKPDVAQQRQPRPTPQPTPEAKPETQPRPATQPETRPEPKPEPKPETKPQPAPVVTPAPATPTPSSDTPAETPQVQPTSPQQETEQETKPKPEPAPQPQPVMPPLHNVADAAQEPTDADDPSPTEPYRALDHEELDRLYERVRREPLETAELELLLDLFEAFAQRAEQNDDPAVRVARARAEHLRLMADVQRQRNEINAIRARARIAAQRTEAAQLANDAGGNYIAVGRLTTSTVYDGQRLPRLLRVQDPGTGQTVAYMKPDDQFDTAGMLGQLVGIIGNREYDGGLRLNILTARRIDILSPR